MQNTALQDAINELLALNQFGRHAEMEARARSLLKSFPGVAVLRELLGMALAAQQRYSDALPYLRRAVRDDPGDPLFWDNLAFCLLQLGDVAAAEMSLREATVRHPDSLSTWATLANVLISRQQYQEARAALGRVLAAAPDDPHANFLAGRVAAAQRDHADAERHLRKVIATSPDVGAAHNELALVLQDKGELEQAEACFRRALVLDGDSPPALVNLGLLLSTMNRPAEAADAARTALAMLEREGISDANIGLFDTIANLLDGAEQTAEALKVFKMTFGFRPQPLRAVWAIYAARRACDWTFAAILEREACRVAGLAEAIDESAPWRLLGLASAGPAVQLAAARKCAARVTADGTPAISRPSRTGDGGRLRIGYFSGDLYSHPTSHLMVGVVEQHDRSRFEIVAYDFSPPARDDYRSRFEAAFDRMVAIGGLQDQAAAQRIADDSVDILVDLIGWTRRSRPAVLAARPAPLQVQWLGYPGTVGAPWIDYIVADDVLIPKGQEGGYSEKILRLPGSYQPNDDRRPIPAPPDRKDHGLPATAFVFCSFNSTFKITPELFDTWLDLLAAVDDSVLWLIQPEDIAAQALRAVAVDRGIDPGRIVFAARVEPAQHLARLPLADLALDCFPYGSHTTASEMLWAGVPLVALTGETFASRVSASVLNAAGLADLTTHSLDAYRDLALRLSKNRDELAALRARIDRQRAASPLFDTAGFTRGLEAAYEAIWARHLGGLAADHIDIARSTLARDGAKA